MNNRLGTIQGRDKDKTWQGQDRDKTWGLQGKERDRQKQVNKRQGKDRDKIREEEGKKVGSWGGGGGKGMVRDRYSWQEKACTSFKKFSGGGGWLGGVESDYSVCPHLFLQFFSFCLSGYARLCQVMSGYVSLFRRDRTWSSTILLILYGTAQLGKMF